MPEAGHDGRQRRPAIERPRQAERGERRVTYAQAHVEALNSNPTLYLQYLKEGETALSARRG